MSGETMVCAAAIFNGAPLAIRPAFSTIRRYLEPQIGDDEGARGEAR
jgi:hypothetical protein